MRLQKVTFAGIRGVRDAAHGFGGASAGTSPDVVVIVGPPASGKTRLLEAIVAAKEAIGSYGPMVVGAPWIAAGAPVARITLGFLLDDEERAFAGATTNTLEGEVTFFPDRARAEAPDGLTRLLERFSVDPSKGKLEYFPADRRLPSHGPFDGLSAAEQRLYRPTRDPRKYSFVVRFLQQLEGDPDRTSLFAARLEALSPTARYVTRDAPRSGLPYCLSSRGGPARLPTELSDSEADAVLFAATSVALGLDRSLLLIDRPDLHVEPGGVRRLVAGLRGLGHHNQLFLASPAPELGAAAEPAQTINLEGA